MHIQKLRIENLRSFDKAEIEFNLPGTKGMEFPNVNILLGNNGLGKTTVLRAVALAALGPLLSGSSGFVPEGLVRQQMPIPPKGTKMFLDLEKPDPARLCADLVSTVDEKPSRNSEWFMPDRFSMRTQVNAMSSAERLKWSVEPDTAHASAEEMQYDEKSSAFFIVAYGATRQVETSSRVDESARTRSRLRRYERVAGLFEDHLTLMPLSYWLPKFADENKGRYTQVIHLINELLPPSCRVSETAILTSNGREHLFEMNGMALPFRALSDGFKAYIGWIGDMLFHVCQGVASGQKLRQTRGIVMVDEIDLHLHPEWQRTVVPTLAKALPNIQFIFTTHSPLVVGSLTSENLFVLAQENNATVIRRLPEKVHGKSAEQILLSPYFGLDSTRATDTASALNDLARSAVAGDPDAALEYLKLMSNGLSAKNSPRANSLKSGSITESTLKKAVKNTSERNS